MERQDRQDRGAGALSTPSCAPIETDALIIGAGPVGLFQAFQLGLLEISCHIVDALPRAGGQCVELYGDKPIYDIPGTPVTTGRGLAESLLQQIAPFKPQFHFGEQVATLARQADGRLLLDDLARHRLPCEDGLHRRRRRRLRAASASRWKASRAFEGTRLFYHPDTLDRFAGQSVVVNGGDDAALETALALPATAKAVTLLHRRDVFQAEEATVAAVRERIAAGALRLQVGQPVGFDPASNCRSPRPTPSTGRAALRRPDRLPGHLAAPRPDRRLGTWSSSASSCRSTPRSTRPTSAGCSPSATSTPTPARRS